MIFSLITEKNSKDVFVMSIYTLIQLKMKILIVFILFSPDEKLEDLKARKRKIVSVVVMYTGYCIYYFCILRVLIIWHILSCMYSCETFCMFLKSAFQNELIGTSGTKRFNLCGFV